MPPFMPILQMGKFCLYPQDRGDVKLVGYEVLWRPGGMMLWKGQVLVFFPPWMLRFYDTFLGDCGTTSDSDLFASFNTVQYNSDAYRKGLSDPPSAVENSVK